MFGLVSLCDRCTDAERGHLKRKAAALVAIFFKKFQPDLEKKIF
jgi:hypothetical protein